MSPAQVMSPKQVSEQLSVIEFTALCSILDETYKIYTYFNVVKVVRETRLYAHVILLHDPTRLHEVDITGYFERCAQSAQKEAA